MHTRTKMPRKTRRILTALAASALALGLTVASATPAAACGGHAKKAPTGQAATQSADAAKVTLVHQGEAKVGDHTVCPVMGGEFEITADSPSVEHDGKTIFFCCAGCGDQFAEDPEGMLGAANQSIDELNAAAATE